MSETDTIYSYVLEQESAFKLPIRINDNWEWSMYDHIRLSVLYKNSQLSTGKDDFKPVKNITRPILNLQYRVEGFDVKDIALYIDDSKDYYKSLLVRKYHDKWALDHKIDTFIDELVESYVDFGGALVKEVNDARPEVVPLQSLAFCDQTDILSGPIAIKHYYSPDQLLDMKANGWGNPAKGATATLKETIELAREEKRQNQDTTVTKTPGRYIEVFEVHGMMPNHYLDPSDDSGDYTPQVQIIAYYTKKDSDKKAGITLFAAKEPTSPFKFLARDAIYGRALGFGGAEELFESQVWVNYDQIRIQDMKDAASKTILWSTDPSITQKNRVRNMENLEVIELQPGTQIAQVDTFPRNLALFEKSTQEWETHAQQMGGATETLLGETPTSGTPFALHAALAQQGLGLHQYRQGKIAVFVGEVYRDWVIPYIVKEITQGSTFLADLDLEDLQTVSASLVTCEVNDMKRNVILSGGTVDPQDEQQYQQQVLDEFKKKGKNHFLEVLKGEFNNKDFGVRVNVAGKQKDLGEKVDKLTNVFRTIVSNPYILQSPPIAELFNQIIEASGLDPIDLSQFKMPPMPTRQMRETIDYKDIQDPKAQQQMLQLAGIEQPSQTP